MKIDLSAANWDDLKIVGDRLVLSPLKTQHVSKAYETWLNDAAVNEFLETRWEIQTASTIERYVERISKSKNEILLKIEILATGRHIGNMKIGPIDINHRSSELSYFIGEKIEWGKGFATEAIQVCTSFGFSELGLHKFQAGCYSKNIGSQKALLKAGFHLEGRLEKRILDSKGEWQDHLWFGKLQ